MSHGRERREGAAHERQESRRPQLNIELGAEFEQRHCPLVDRDAAEPAEAGAHRS